MDGLMELRERMAKMEVEISYLKQQNQEQMAILKRLDATFQQARGARWVLVSIAGVCGFLASWLPTFLGWFRGGA